MNQENRSRRTGAPSTWRSEWSHFLENYKDWWDRRLVDCDHVYSLPTPVIDSFAVREARGTRSPFFSRTEADAEHAFNRLCAWRPEIIGVSWAGKPIHYKYMNDDLVNWSPDRKPSESLEACRFFGRAPAVRLAVEQSQMVHVAWLIQQHEYWQELNELKLRWQKMPTPVDFFEISGRGVPLSLLHWQSQKGVVETPELAALFKDLAMFATRWCLLGLMNWDLPLPQFPLLHMPINTLIQHRLETERTPAIPGFLPAERLFGDHRIVWKVPSPDPRRQTPARHKVSDREVGVKAIPRSSNLLKLYLTEVAVQDRFRGRMPRGIVGHMLSGLAEHLGRDVDRIKKMRSGYHNAMQSPP